MQTFLGFPQSTQSLPTLPCSSSVPILFLILISIILPSFLIIIVEYGEGEFILPCPNLSCIEGKLEIIGIISDMGIPKGSRGIEVLPLDLPLPCLSQYCDPCIGPAKQGFPAMVVPAHV